MSKRRRTRRSSGALNNLPHTPRLRVPLRVSYSVNREYKSYVTAMVTKANELAVSIDLLTSQISLLIRASEPSLLNALSGRHQPQINTQEILDLTSQRELLQSRYSRIQRALAVVSEHNYSDKARSLDDIVDNPFAEEKAVSKVSGPGF